MCVIGHDNELLVVSAMQMRPIQPHTITDPQCCVFGKYEGSGVRDVPDPRRRQASTPGNVAATIQPPMDNALLARIKQGYSSDDWFHNAGKAPSSPWTLEGTCGGTNAR